MHLTQKKPVEFVWNGEQTLYLVGLPDNKRIVTATVPQKHNHPMPGLLVPISSGTLHQPNHQQIQQHIILSPALAPPPPPPLDFISNIKVEMKPVIPTLVATHSQPPILPDRPIKVEFTPPPPLYEMTPMKSISNNVKPSQTTTKAKKATTKSQVMTDVLEILIKNGELPETAVFDPTTPTTSIVPNSINQHTQHQAQNPMLFSSLVNASQPDVKPVPDTSDDATSKYLLDPQRPDMDNIEMLSPMPPDCDISVSSFDLFLERQEQKQNEELQQIQQNAQQQSHQEKPDDQLQGLDDLNRVPSLQQPNHLPSSSTLYDLGLMDGWMGHQLDMDMNEDPCHQFTLNNHMRLLNNDNNFCNDESGGSKINRRDPSLQPSLNELIQQQQLQQSQQQNFSNAFGLCHNNNNVNHTNGTNQNHHTNNTLNNNNSNNNHNHLDHLTYTPTPMDIEDFENISSFDLSQITGVSNDHQQINTPPHPFGQSNMQSNLGGQQPQHHNQQPMMTSQQPSGSHLNHHQHLNQEHPHLLNNYESMSSSHDAYDTPLALNSENILDIFNIDDFKMSNDNSLPWSEVDFAA